MHLRLGSFEQDQEGFGAEGTIFFAQVAGCLTPRVLPTYLQRRVDMAESTPPPQGRHDLDVASVNRAAFLVKVYRTYHSCLQAIILFS